MSQHSIKDINEAVEEKQLSTQKEQEQPVNPLQKKIEQKIKPKEIQVNKMGSNGYLPKLFAESASTLVHTSGPSHMFPKQKRFNFSSQFDESINKSSISKVDSSMRRNMNKSIMSQSTLSNIKYTIPVEKRDVFKNQLTRHIDTNMKLVPGSNNYEQLSQLLQSSSNIYCNGKFQGRTFASNRTKYDKVYLPQAHDGRVKKFDEFTMRHSVGPGRYKVVKPIGISSYILYSTEHLLIFIFIKFIYTHAYMYIYLYSCSYSFMVNRDGQTLDHYFIEEGNQL